MCSGDRRDAKVLLRKGILAAGSATGAVREHRHGANSPRANAAGVRYRFVSDASSRAAPQSGSHLRTLPEMPPSTAPVARS